MKSEYFIPSVNGKSRKEIVAPMAELRTRPYEEGPHFGFDAGKNDGVGKRRL
jgi:hypothetical protein